jgi:streptomycin 6-kinase
VTTVRVPASLRSAFAARPEAAAWLAGLPGTVHEACARWDLTLDLPPSASPWHGVSALVVPVRCHDGDQAVLKVTWPHPEARDEALGLRRWDGDGAVRLLATDGAWTHLLERLDGDDDLTRQPIDTAVAVIGDLLGRLHRAAAPASLAPLSLELGALVDRWTARLDDAAPVPRPLLERALGLASDLLDDPRDGTLLHCDLHYANVLAATREPWLAIDPKPRSGDPAYEVAPLLWNRLDEITSSASPAAALRSRLQVACAHAGIAPERAAAWAVVREVQNAYWAAESGDRDELDVHLGLAALLTT